MNIHQISARLAIALFLVVLVFPAWANSGDDDGSGDGDDYDDFFNFYDENKWSDFAIIAKKCITFKQTDVVVFDMFGEGHNQCKKNRKLLGTYTASIPNFIKAYTQQMEENAEIQGSGFEVSEDAMELLQCSAYNYNNEYIYLKIGCGANTGKAFQIFSYSDEDCTKKLSTQVNVNTDISTLKVSFNTCTNCVWPINKGDDDKAYDDGFYYDEYDSPLCSAAWNYKSECNGRCKKLARTYNQNKRHFSAVGKFFLLTLSVLGTFLLLAVLAQRKKMSTQDTLLEETAIKKVGLEMKYMPRVVIGLIIFISLLMLVRAKALTWFCLIIADTSLFAYWSYLKYRAEGHLTIGGVQLYSDDEHS